MSDPLLEEIWRVRSELLKKYGGIDGYFKYIQNRDRARLRKEAAQRKARGKRTTKVRKLAS